MSLKDNLLGLIIICIWGFNFVVIAWGVQDIPPLLLGAARFLMIAAIGSLFVKKPDIPWRWMALYAFTLCFGQFAFLFSALAYGMPAGLASLVLQSQALFTLLFGALLLKETVRLYQLLAVGLAFIGLWQIAVAGQETDMTAIGFAFTIAGAIAWALGNIVNRVINNKGYKANLGLVVWSSWVAFIPFLLSGWYLEGTQAVIDSVMFINQKSLFVIAYLAFAASIVGYSLWSHLLAKYPAGQVAPLTLAVPVVGLVCAQWFLGEEIESSQIAGMVLVMIGLVINTLGGKVKALQRLKLSK